MPSFGFFVYVCGNILGWSTAEKGFQGEMEAGRGKGGMSNVGMHVGIYSAVFEMETVARVSLYILLGSIEQI